MHCKILAGTFLAIMAGMPGAAHAQAVEVSIEQRVSQARAQSAALSPKDREAVKALFSSAFQLWKNGDFKSARLGFENGLTRDPANGIAHFYLAETLMRLNDRRRARAHYEMAAALVPTTQEGLKAQSALASLPAFKPMASGAAPEFPPEVPNQVQEALLNSPVFASLPVSLPISCESENKFEIQGKPHRNVARTTRQAGRGGIVTTESTSDFHQPSGQISSTSTGQSTLAGLLPLFSSSSSKDGSISKTVTAEIRRLEGEFFPLKSGNRFRFEYLSTLDKYRSNFSHSCEVKGTVSPEQTPSAIRGDENFVVECEWTLTLESNPAARASSYRTYHICSSTLGLCAYSWPSDAGSGVPNLEGGFRYTGPGGGTNEWRMTCNR